MVLPVTLPDGRRFELRYPRQLRLAEMGFHAGASIAWPVRSDPLRCCGKGVAIVHTTIAALYGHATPIKTYRGVHGHRVPYYGFSPSNSTSLHYLVFQFGAWMVQVYDLPDRNPANFEDRMTDAERATWARSLDGHVDKRGYLVLTPHAPLRIQRDLGFVLGPVEFAGHQYCVGPNVDTAKPRRFSQAGQMGAAWCDPGTGLHISVTGAPDLVDAVVFGLTIRRVAPAT